MCNSCRKLPTEKPGDTIHLQQKRQAQGYGSVLHLTAAGNTGCDKSRLLSVQPNSSFQNIWQ